MLLTSKLNAISVSFVYRVNIFFLILYYFSYLNQFNLNVLIYW